MQDICYYYVLKNMCKRLFLQLLLIITAQLAMAQTTGKCLVVNLKDGSSERFLLADKPYFIMNGEYLNTSKGGTAIVYNRGDIKDFTFEDVNSAGIKAAEASGELLVRQTSDGHIMVSGLSGGDQVRVCSLGGKMLSAVRSDNSGRADIALPVAKGVYIVNIANKRTLKIQKK